MYVSLSPFYFLFFSLSLSVFLSFPLFFPFLSSISPRRDGNLASLPFHRTLDFSPRDMTTRTRIGEEELSLRFALDKNLFDLHNLRRQREKTYHIYLMSNLHRGMGKGTFLYLYLLLFRILFG